MKKFVLIDHSLRDLGGHYYTYACCVLPAAERAGFKAVLATHRDFRESAALPDSWTAHAVYRRKSYAGHATITPAATRGLRTLFGGLLGAMRRWRDMRIAQSFAADCGKLFGCVKLTDGDQVFIATATELDLYGLGLYLRSSRRCPAVTWHLQFHVGLFDGRDPDYGPQVASKVRLREFFLEALRLAQGHKVHLYCTTEQLTEQYRLLGVAPFDTLTYPVHPLFQKRDEDGACDAQVRIACLGHNRKEKGYRLLPNIIRNIWCDYLRAGQAQILLQTARRDLRRALDDLVAQLGTTAADAVEPIAYAAFPLTLDRYAALVRSAGIGLLLYDGAQYYARCSGVLIEMLSAGVPVIVPAGCWLAEQICEENQRYIEELVSASTDCSVVECNRVDWQPSDSVVMQSNGSAPSPALALRAGAAVVSQFDTFIDCASLVVRFRWSQPLDGIYVRIVAEQLDDRGYALGEFENIVAHRRTDGAIHAMFRLQSNARRIRVRLANAWNESEIRIDSLEFLLLRGEQRPLGSVGLTAANVEQSGELLREILRYYKHYRRSASQFAAQCAQLHDASRIVAQLSRSSATVQESIP